MGLGQEDRLGLFVDSGIQGLGKHFCSLLAAQLVRSFVEEALLVYGGRAEQAKGECEGQRVGSEDHYASSLANYPYDDE